MMIAIKLAKAGYYGGDPQKILHAPTDIVMAAMQYEKFLSDYEHTYFEINKNRDI